jgi:peptide/nickel transport system substrate-binding protein
MQLAQEYMKKAGYASGKYEGDDELLMVAANADPGKAQAEVARAQIEKLGFKIKFRVLPQDVVYNEYCQLPAKKVAICGSAGWFKDFTDAQSMLEPTFKGSAIVTDGGLNNNLAQLNVPEIDSAMDKATLLTGDERIQAWADIDKQITEAAPAVPFLWDKSTLIWSKDVNGVASDYYNTVDFAWASLK